jgi:hypothetical protein
VIPNNIFDLLTPLSLAYWIARCALRAARCALRAARCAQWIKKKNCYVGRRKKSMKKLVAFFFVIRRFKKKKLIS